MSLNGLEDILSKHGLTDEVKAALLADVNGAVNPILNKKTELERVIANNPVNDSKTAEFEALKLFKQNSELKATEDAASYQEAKQLTADQHKADMLKLNERISAYEQGERSRLITDGIRSELTALNVNPLLSDAMTSYFETQSQVVDGKAMIGDKTQAEFIAAWSETDSGKASILGQQNSNSGGLGGDKTPAAAPDSLEACKGDKALEAAYFTKQLEG